MSGQSAERPTDTDRKTYIGQTFREWFEAACVGDLTLSESQLVPARQYQYIFVSGFHNEVMPLYFWGNIRELRRLGIPSKNIHRLHPSSHDRFETTADRVATSFARLADRNAGRLVIIGHSRGACATLAAALQNAAWFCDHLEAMFLIQGPFGGTAIADYVIASEHRFPETWPRRRLGLARSLSSIERFALRLGWDAGLHDLTHETSRRFWARRIEESREGSRERAMEIERKSYFITTRIEPERSRFPRSELGHILQECDGPNDGVVALADQSIEGFGTRLGPLEAAHTDLVWGLYSAREARMFRRALVRSILRVLADRHPIAAGRRDGGPSGG